MPWSAEDVPKPQNQIQVRYFAWVREKVGRADEQVAPPDTVKSVSDLMQWLKARGPEYEAAFAKTEIIRTAIDQKHVRGDAPIGNAKEIAFFPPVTGG